MLRSGVRWEFKGPALSNLSNSSNVSIGLSKIVERISSLKCRASFEMISLVEGEGVNPLTSLKSFMVYAAMETFLAGS